MKDSGGRRKNGRNHEEIMMGSRCWELTNIRRLVEYATATADPFVPGYEGELNRWLQPPPGEGCGCTVQ